MVELPVRKEVPCLLAYYIIVLLRPALLQTNNVWSGVCGGDLVSNFFEALAAKLGYELEPPAIERQDSQIGGRLFRSHCEVCDRELVRDDATGEIDGAVAGIRDPGRHRLHAIWQNFYVAHLSRFRL
tara:strand:- start:41819 stop:42199 length:381 start_codon:yes stop_codon:yes gene_type:complete